ncbi:LPS assembly lipoprotein LptE [Polycladidibacter stylochi]|uniref:LPS assembly lipoprotein LptE n=1 Tax=Polycladidibacter stylochi TaxID=1807766 RepID=UPI00082990F8|nr:LPS assembly lipoprotein LptE [Pseudovibrio stylochi]
MSLSNRSRFTPSSARRFITGGAAVVFGVLSLTACQFRPLYGELPTSNQTGKATGTVQQELASVDIAISSYASASGIDRATQVMKNELTYGFRGAHPLTHKKYDLKIQADKIISSVGVQALADVPSAYSLTINTSFILVDSQTEKTLYTGRSFAEASYDFSSQRFANERAERNAEDRAVKVVAKDIQVRLASYFATHEKAQD